MNAKVINLVDTEPSETLPSEAYLVMPSGLMPSFIQLVADYAAQHREDNFACCRAVEITVIQRGIRSLRDELDANKRLSMRLGWQRGEGT